MKERRGREKRGKKTSWQTIILSEDIFRNGPTSWKTSYPVVELFTFFLPKRGRNC